MGKASETPILTKKQQKLSLTGKKTKTKEVIKNVLASPYTKYWPLISSSHHQTLKNILNQCLPKILQDKVKILWKELKKVPKCERKKFRDDYTRKHLGNEYQPEILKEREGLILGINDVTKALEKEIARCVLVAEDVQPRLMVEHVIDQAVLINRSVLVVPELRTILKEKCGITSAAVAFTDCPRYKLVQDTVENISKNYPVPEDHINFDRAQKLLNDSVIVIDDSIIENISRTNIKDADIESKDKQENKNKEESGSDTNEDPVKNVYLIRKHKGERVFIPEKSVKEPKKDIMDVDSSGFLSFSFTTTSDQKVRKKYTSLKIKRIRGDTNRNKRKIEAMKQKKILHKSKKSTQN